MTKLEQKIEKEWELRAAHKAGRDRAKNGPNTENCHFSIFSSKQKTKAWEHGASGIAFNFRKILEESI